MLDKIHKLICNNRHKWKYFIIPNKTNKVTWNSY